MLKRNDWFSIKPGGLLKLRVMGNNGYYLCRDVFDKWEVCRYLYLSCVVQLSNALGRFIFEVWLYFVTFSIASMVVVTLKVNSSVPECSHFTIKCSVLCFFFSFIEHILFWPSSIASTWIYVNIYIYGLYLQYRCRKEKKQDGNEKNINYALKECWVLICTFKVFRECALSLLLL